MFKNLITKQEAPNKEKHPNQKVYDGKVSELAKEIWQTKSQIAILESKLTHTGNVLEKKDLEQKLEGLNYILSWLNRSKEQLNCVKGVVTNFDKENMKKVMESSKPEGKACLVKDEEGLYYLCGHGHEITTTDENGKSSKAHHIIDHKGNEVNTNQYISQLIEDKKIPSKASLRIVSCYVSTLDTSITYQNGVKVQPVTNEEGEVYLDNNSAKNNIIAFGGRKQITR